MCFANKIRKKIDQDRLTGAVFIVSRAFDTINHEVLLNKLRSLGVNMSGLETIYRTEPKL